MSEQTYRVLFKGIKVGGDFETSQGRIAKIFKLDEVEAGEWLSGKPRTIKAKVDKETAEKYKAAIENAGACCQIISNPQPEEIAVQEDLEVDRAATTPAVVAKRALRESASARKADEKFCTACGKIVHASASNCTQCGAIQVTHQAPAPVAIMANSKAVDQKFCTACASVMHVTAPQCPSCGAKQSGGSATSSKNKTTAGILALLLGGVGTHKFYLGRIGIGIIYLCLFWTGIPAVVALVEGINYLVMDEDKFNLRVSAGTI